MITQSSLLVMLVRLVDYIPVPTLPTVKQGRGRPSFYSDRLFLKALVIMIIKHLHTPYELLSVLQQPTAEMQVLRALLVEGGRYPCRRTWERRLAARANAVQIQVHHAHPGGVVHNFPAVQGVVPEVVPLVAV